MKNLLALFILSSTCSAWAIDCPVRFGTEDYGAQVSAKISATKNCYDGVALANACALGSSMDETIGGAAESKCGLDFLKILTPEDMTIYKNLLTKCDHKYENQQGTMYISFNAFCRVKVAELYSELYSPVPLFIKTAP